MAKIINEEIFYIKNYYEKFNYCLNKYEWNNYG
jgi:hypothetical protein